MTLVRALIIIIQNCIYGKQSSSMTFPRKSIPGIISNCSRASCADSQVRTQAAVKTQRTLSAEANIQWREDQAQNYGSMG